MHTTPSTQHPQVQPEPGEIALEPMRPSRPPYAAQDAACDYDGVRDGDEARVASWLHLSLGLETG